MFMDSPQELISLYIYIANISYTKCMHINLMLDTFLKEATLRASILPTLRW